MAFNQPEAGIPRRKPESVFPSDSLRAREQKDQESQESHFAHGPACRQLGIPTLRQNVTTRGSGITRIPPFRGYRTDQNTTIIRPESAKVTKSDKSDKVVQNASFRDFRTLFSTFVDYIGVLPGFSALLSLLFQNNQESSPKAGRPKVTKVVIPARPGSRPICRQE